jgi:excisionase family DNA binding protein
MRTITITQAAELTGINRNTIGLALRSGALAGLRIGESEKAVWRTTEADVAAWLQRLHQQAQPRTAPLTIRAEATR